MSDPDEDMTDAEILAAWARGEKVELRSLALGEWRCCCGVSFFSLKECGVPVTMVGRCHYCGDSAEVIAA